MRKAIAVASLLALASGTAFANEASVPDENAPVTEERSSVPLVMFISFTTIAVGTFGLNVYSNHAIQREADLAAGDLFPSATGSISDQDCGNEGYRAQSRHFDSACSWNRVSAITMPITLIAIPAAVISGYFAFRSQPKKEKRSVALVPTVTTKTAGAMLDIRW